jgi:hypothetical protein
MTNIEYFKSCFIRNKEQEFLGIGCDDTDTAWAYNYCADKEKFLAGFQEYVNENQQIFNNYSVKQFKSWMDTTDFDQWHLDAMKCKTWDEYLDFRSQGFKQETSKIHLVN